MAFTAKNIPFKATHSFSSLVIDYLAGSEKLTPFYTFAPNLEGIERAIEERKNFSVDRKLLVKRIKDQYKGYGINSLLEKNIEALESENCFTICTAHQPNIFTGHLYFIYKILHAVKLADELKGKHGKYDFIPVYYMGSEDADLQELGELEIAGKHFQWETKQKGAVGRMTVDKALIQIIDEVAQQIEVLPFGKEVILKIRSCYSLGQTIENATFAFVHLLLGNYGVIILMPDCDDLKRPFLPIVEKELSEQFSNKAVTNSIKNFPEEYKVQTTGREINLFYLEDDQRERVQEQNGKFSVDDDNSRFSKEEILKKFEEHPARISPNVILRPVFQEAILPNIVFIGGGGELAYWLELKDVFAAANVFFPVLILRNSFAIMTKKMQDLQNKLQIEDAELFSTKHNVFDNWINKNSDQPLLVEAEKERISLQYAAIKKVAEAHDASLSKHVEALKTAALNKLDTLEKKILRAARQREEATGRQIEKLKNSLFPKGTLQERVDNIVYWYALYGGDIIDVIYHNSTGSDSSFQLLKED